MEKTSWRGLAASLMLALGASIALVGCGGGGGDGPAPPPDVPPADVTLDYGVYNDTTVTIGVPVAVVPQMTGLNGHAPTCTVSSGTLPEGMMLRSDCTLLGTAQGTAEGESRFTVALTVPGYAATATANVAVDTRFARIDYTGLPPALGFFTTLTWDLPIDATVASVDGFPLSSVDGYQVVSGTLPVGLLLDAATGRIAGTPTQADQPMQAIVIQATAHTASGDYVVFAPLNLGVGSVYENALSMVYYTPGPAKVGVFYSMAPTFVGARFPIGEYTANFSSSIDPQDGCTQQFPAMGLALDVWTGAISGTPTSSGTFCTMVNVQLTHSDEAYAYVQAIVQVTIDP